MDFQKHDSLVEFGEIAAKNLAIDISAPPCPQCKYWRPRMKTDNRGELQGIVLCAKIGDQMNDFSCFDGKEST